MWVLIIGGVDVVYCEYGSSGGMHFLMRKGLLGVGRGDGGAGMGKWVGLLSSRSQTIGLRQQMERAHDRLFWISMQEIMTMPADQEVVDSLTWKFFVSSNP